MTAQNLPSALHAPSVAVVRAVQNVSSGSMTTLWFCWILILFEPDWFLTYAIGGPWYRIPTLLLPLLIVLIARAGFSRVQYWPFTLYMVHHVFSSIFAENRGYSLVSLKTLMYFYLVALLSRAFIRTPVQGIFLIKLCLFSLLWYAQQGLLNGARVFWHPLLANEDSFGPLMVTFMGLAYYFGMASKSRAWKIFGAATFALCVFGFVASFARGAVLSAGLVIFVIWLRSPHKIATLGGGIVAGGLFLLAVAVFFPTGEFWREMQTVSEGTEGGTGQTRWILWNIAINVWKTAPLFGVGASNFGVIASEITPLDLSRAIYQDPSTLYSSALHNAYVQVLCEQGIAGIILFGYMLTDLHRRIGRLGSRAAIEIWNRNGGEGFDLRLIARGIEVSLVGFYANAFFYNQTYIHWFWTLLTFVLVLSDLTTSPRGRPGARAQHGP